MPTLETLERFIAQVEANAYAEAVEAFYTADASLQENQEPPRVGRDFHIAKERAMMSRVRSMSSTCVRPAFLDGDHVAIRWIFRFEWADGSVTRMEEIAHQRWEGERIAEEQFFYDPQQRIPSKPGVAA